MNFCAQIRPNFYLYLLMSAIKILFTNMNKYLSEFIQVFKKIFPVITMQIKYTFYWICFLLFDIPSSFNPHKLRYDNKKPKKIFFLLNNVLTKILFRNFEEKISLRIMSFLCSKWGENSKKSTIDLVFRGLGQVCYCMRSLYWLKVWVIILKILLEHKN